VNLLDNAVKYARDREPRRIEVALTRRDGAIDLTVRDHGPGLGPEDRARVFDPFFRGSSPSTREVGGAGLGLSLVRRFARAHGGTAGRRGRSGRRLALPGHVSGRLSLTSFSPTGSSPDPRAR
jgi:signal transduction histidine kinase